MPPGSYQASVVGGDKWEDSDELFKYEGLIWQVRKKGVKLRVESSYAMCTNCLGRLDSDLKCLLCTKQHKATRPFGELAELATEALNATRRRKEYRVIAAQVGEKMAEADLRLPDSKFMHVDLENRKGTEQVVITVGDTNQNRKAQIFVDLAKNEIRHDPTNDDPKAFVSAIELNTTEQAVKKQFTTKSKPEDQLSHPYIYVSGSSFTKWADASSLALNVNSDEEEEYFVEQMELEGFVSQLGRALRPKAITPGLVIMGEILPFAVPNPRFKMVVSRAGRRYLIEQELRTSSRADGKFNLDAWVEKPSRITELTEEI